jgi:hypothetical protein
MTRTSHMSDGSVDSFFLPSRRRQSEMKPFVYVSTSISLVDNSCEFPAQSYEFVQLDFLSDLCFGRVREHEDENGNNRNGK